jgi:hypothetical protein
VSECIPLTPRNSLLQEEFVRSSVTERATGKYAAFCIRKEQKQRVVSLPPVHLFLYSFRDSYETVQINPYLKFLKKPEHLAATWRPKDEFVVPSGMSLGAAAPLLVDPQKTLNDKAKAVTNAVSNC